MRKKIIALVGTLGLALAACSPASDTGDAEKPQVTTAFYPLTYLVNEIAGDSVEVTDLTPSGGDAHGLELSPSDIEKMQKSDLVLYVAKLTPSIDDAVAAADVKSLNVAEHADLLPYAKLTAETAPGGENDDFFDSDDRDDNADDHDDYDDYDDHHADVDDDHDDHADHDDDDDHGHHHDHGVYDPHFWTDPERMAEVAPVIAAELGKINPAQKDEYMERAKALKEQLDNLSDKYETAFEAKTCRTNAFIVSHEAFGYLAEDFDLVQIGVSGIDPEIEPSPARIKEITDLAKKYQIDTLFATSDAELRSMQSIAEESNLKVAVLDPAATQRDPNKDYLAVLEENFKRLLSANGC